MTTRTPSLRRFSGRRLAVTAAAWLLGLYVLLVVVGFSWLHHSLKNGGIGPLDVAFIRWHKVRQAMAVEQFAAGRAAREAGNTQAAYLAFVSGIRNDPDNVEGRLDAARFLGAAGAVKLETNVLEDGLRRAPDDRRLIEETFALLTASGLDRHALDLIHRQYAAGLAGPNGLLVRRFEVLATLNSGGGASAKTLLDGYPDLRKDEDSAPVVARVLWETKERLPAVDLLSTFLKLHDGAFILFARLAEWQIACGLADDAVHTAERACAKSPGDFPPRVLHIEMTAAARGVGASPWQQAIESYLKDFGDRPEAITMLAGLAGEKGWTGLARVLYDVSANRQQNLGALALAYSGALASNAQYGDAARVLSDVEAQVEDGNPALLRLLRQRQIEVAAARGDHDAAREYARRLAATLQKDPDGMEVVRRRFELEKIPEAVAELAAASGMQKAPAAK